MDRKHHKQCCKAREIESEPENHPSTAQLLRCLISQGSYQIALLEEIAEALGHKEQVSHVESVTVTNSDPPKPKSLLARLFQ